MTRLWPEGSPIQVISNQDNLPLRFQWQDTWHEVTGIANRWRTQSGWWTVDAATWREYIKLTTGDGLLCTLYRDLHTGAWYCARVYD